MESNRLTPCPAHASFNTNCSDCEYINAAPKKQVGHTEMKKLPYIIAIDFDGTLVTDKFPEIGEKNEKLFADAIRWRKEGAKLILHTCRDDNTAEMHLTRAVNYCFDNGLSFDAVNRNIPEVIELFKNDTRKVYANVYIDDKSLRPSIHEVFAHYDPIKDFKPWKMKIPMGGHRRIVWD